MSASRAAKSIITTSEFGSADLCDAMHANILPRTFGVGCPHVVVSSTSGKERPIPSTALKVDARVIASCRPYRRTAVLKDLRPRKKKPVKRARKGGKPERVVKNPPPVVK